MFKIVQKSVKVVQRNVLLTHLYTEAVLIGYAQNPVFEIVHGESVIVYLYMYSGNVQQNPLCVESSCVTKVFSTFPGSRLRFFIAMQIQYSYKY